MSFFTLFVFICVLWCPTHIVLCFRFVFSSFYVPYVASSPNNSSLIAVSVFSNVYLKYVNYEKKA
jgi:hypothetical protein